MKSFLNTKDTKGTKEKNFVSFVSFVFIFLETLINRIIFLEVTHDEQPSTS